VIFELSINENIKLVYCTVITKNAISLSQIFTCSGYLGGTTPNKTGSVCNRDAREPRKVQLSFTIVNENVVKLSKCKNSLTAPSKGDFERSAMTS